ncbi:MAG: Helix-turn-helix domain, partial [Nocardioidaceae bacterium]|nr:Helix-turn-helix domain [Nocardioidaceae bacterium]
MTRGDVDDTAPGDVLTALAHPTRRRQHEQLSAAGSATATGLADRLPITPQAVVQHHAVL